MLTLADAYAYTRSHPRRDLDGKLMSWHGYCESFVSRASGTPYRSSALLAASASSIVSSDIDSAPAGTFGFSRGVVIDGVDYGHVWINTGGGGALMASSAVTNRLGGGDAGTIPIRDYLRKFPNQRVIGWSWDHCGGRFAQTSAPVEVTGSITIQRFNVDALTKTFEKDEDAMQIFMAYDNRSGRQEMQTLAFSPLLGVFDPFTGTGLSPAVALRVTGQEDANEVWGVSNEETDQLRNLGERTADVFASRYGLTRPPRE